MHGEGVVLEIDFVEADNKQYTQMFVETLRDRFRRELPSEQLALLAQAIEESRLSGQAPVDLAENVDDNWKAIFG